MSRQGSTNRISAQSVSNFIDKTYEILENADNESIISWSGKGSSFIVKDVVAFSNNILPKYFKHSNFSSFVRQLNMYNFHKVRGDRLENQFEHCKFRKDHRELLTQIKRKGNDPSEQLGQAPAPELDLLKKTTEKDNRNLELLAEENRKLKKLKHKYSVERKATESDEIVQEKLYKFLTTILSLKLKSSLCPEAKLQPMANPPINHFDKLTQHIVSMERPQTYEYYEKCCRVLLDRCREQTFMVQMEDNVIEKLPSLQQIIFEKEQQMACKHQ